MHHFQNSFVELLIADGFVALEGHAESAALRNGAENEAELAGDHEVGLRFEVVDELSACVVFVNEGLDWSRRI